MNIVKVGKGLKSVLLAVGAAFFYGCVNTMSKGNLRTDAMYDETLDMPLQEAVSNKPDLFNISSLVIIILILGLLFWKKGSTCCSNKGTGKK